MNEHTLPPKCARLSVRTLACYIMSMVCLTTGALPASAISFAFQSQQTCRTIGDFAVCGRFLDEWNKQGSDKARVYVNGLPITGRRVEISLIDGKNYDTQWFE